MYADSGKKRLNLKAKIKQKSGGAVDAGRFFVSAVGETQLAAVYFIGDPLAGEPGEGLFSHWFVNQGMLQGNANIHDYDQDSVVMEPNQVTVEEAFDYAEQNTSAVRRNPVIIDNFQNDLLL